MHFRANLISLKSYVPLHWINSCLYFSVHQLRSMHDSSLTIFSVFVINENCFNKCNEDCKYWLFVPCKVITKLVWAWHWHNLAEPQVLQFFNITLQPFCGGYSHHFPSFVICISLLFSLGFFSWRLCCITITWFLDCLFSILIIWTAGVIPHTNLAMRSR